MDGLVVVDKPPGWTSHDVVAKLRRVFGLRRVGHAGTLDPEATGVLLVGLGRVTRLLRFLAEGPKVYRGEVVFGVATDTLDAAGRVTRSAPMPGLTAEDVAGAVERFVGDIEQVPPMVSAVKVEGRRLHELHRAGVEVERKARRVHIGRIDVEEFAGGDHPRAVLVVECGGGTYIRVLAADLGAALGGPAHLGWLRRTSVGPFGEGEAHPIDEVVEAGESVVLPPVEAVRHMERVEVDADIARGVSHGAVFPVSVLAPGEGAGPVAVVGPGGNLLALYQRGGSAARPVVVLAGS